MSNELRTVKIEKLETYPSRSGREWVELWGLPVDGIAYPNYIVAYTDDPMAQDTLFLAQLQGTGLVTVGVTDTAHGRRIVSVEEVERVA